MTLTDPKLFLLEGLDPLSDELMLTLGGGYGPPSTPPSDTGGTPPKYCCSCCLVYYLNCRNLNKVGSGYGR